MIEDEIAPRMTLQAEIADRIRDNTKRLIAKTNHRKRVLQKDVARAMGISSQHFTNFLQGKYSLSLRQIDKLADALGVSPSELVRRTNEPLYELTHLEARFMGYMRTWEREVQLALVSVFDYLHGRLPADDRTLKMFRLWGQLDAEQRQMIYGAAFGLREGGLPPDVRVGLGLPARAGRRSVGAKTKQKPPKDEP